ncbi:hypothetical protein BB558_007487 [Smittium angustum]|uniref:Uncharacterized protein n=1 Tax=Smittium angustum TaxID=133377 RepID=A0A2U1IUU9_SMIAN|nr:hypothetical protein BB558_007487 [Smittium angustum]
MKIGNLIGYLAICKFATVLSLPNNKCNKFQETSLDQLYLDALKEGGNLVVYEGGDEKDQQLFMNVAFNARFPGINATLVVDLSKNHAAEIDKQLKEKRLIPSVVNTQTLYDVFRWKDEGVLMPFRPPNWDKVYPGLKDPELNYICVSNFFFAPNALKSTVEAGEAPVEDTDFLKPEFKNRIVLTYPQDDDAVLFRFHKLVQEHGWEYVQQLQNQNVLWTRGTQTPGNLIANGTVNNGVTFTLYNFAVPPPDAVVIAKIPEKSSFSINIVFASIFKDAPHPAAAKLYIAWKLSQEFQESNLMIWPTRQDIQPQGGLKKIYDYPNASPSEFIEFMKNTTHHQELRDKITQIIGPVIGPSPLDTVG